MNSPCENAIREDQAHRILEDVQRPLMVNGMVSNAGTWFVRKADFIDKLIELANVPEPFRACMLEATADVRITGEWVNSVGMLQSEQVMAIKNNMLGMLNGGKQKGGKHGKES